MRASKLVITALAPFIALGWVIPVESDSHLSLVARSRHCYNAPSTVAGDLLPHSLPRSERSELHPRGRDTTPVVWCGFGSKTYISVDYISDMHDQSWNGVDDFLDAVGAGIKDRIRTTGDTTVPGGMIKYQNPGLMMMSQNANNHQQTWGVLGAGISALSEYMRAQKGHGYSPSSVAFLLYDGPNQVANATFGPRVYGW